MANATSADRGRAEFETSESGVRYYCRAMPAVFARAVNARLWDEAGVEYIDFLSGCGSLNYGHNNRALKSRVIDYLAGDGLLNGLDLHSVAKRDFLRGFREIILEPRGLSYRVQFTGPTGTNAVEAALKLARKVTGRQSVVAFTNAFHGMTLGALTLNGKQRSRASAGAPLGDVVRLPYQGYRGAGTDAIDLYEHMVCDAAGSLDPPAAFIVETVQGEGGLNCASPDWLRHLGKAAKRLGALVIVDDVQAGCGRTGRFFSFEDYGIVPDLVCLAKSIGGIGLPMALLLVKPDYDQWAPGEHNGTFRGNNLAFVAARAALEFWTSPPFLRTLAQTAERLRQWITDICARLGGEIARPKGRGLMVGIAFADDGIAERVAAEAFARQLIIETAGPRSEVLKLLPPLTIEPSVLEDGLRRLEAAIATARRSPSLRSAA